MNNPKQKFVPSAKVKAIRDWAERTRSQQEDTPSAVEVVQPIVPLQLIAQADVRASIARAKRSLEKAAEEIVWQIEMEAWVSPHVGQRIRPVSACSPALDATNRPKLV